MEMQNKQIARKYFIKVHGYTREITFYKELTEEKFKVSSGTTSAYCAVIIGATALIAENQFRDTRDVLKSAGKFKFKLKKDINEILTYFEDKRRHFKHAHIFTSFDSVDALITDMATRVQQQAALIKMQILQYLTANNIKDYKIATDFFFGYYMLLKCNLFYNVIVSDIKERDGVDYGNTFDYYLPDRATEIAKGIVADYMPLKAIKEILDLQAIQDAVTLYSRALFSTENMLKTTKDIITEFREDYGEDTVKEITDSYEQYVKESQEKEIKIKKENRLNERKARKKSEKRKASQITQEELITLKNKLQTKQ